MIQTRPRRRDAFGGEADAYGVGEGEKFMAKIEYDAQVCVQGLRFNPDDNLWHGYVRWDGIGFAEAVRRVRALPLKEQVGATIFASTGVFGVEAIHEIYERFDFPGF